MQRSAKAMSSVMANLLSHGASRYLIKHYSGGVYEGISIGGLKKNYCPPNVSGSHSIF